MASDDPNEPQLSLHDLPDGVLDAIMRCHIFSYMF